MEHQLFEYENTYEFSVETNPYDDEENETIEGDVTFSADAEWDELDEEYVYSDISWSETSGRFTTFGDSPNPDLEEKFLDDFRAYLISQGVDSNDIGW